jgi:signal transduction histidine kinase
MNTSHPPHDGRSLIVPTVEGEQLCPRGHSVQFYEEDSFLLGEMSRFVGSALGAGGAALVIATKAHRELLKERLSERGLNLSAFILRGQFIAIDAAETLAKFMNDGWPDPARFHLLLGQMIEQARSSAAGSAPLAAFGEMVSLLWEEGKVEAAIRLEQLWNELGREHQFNLLCAYPIRLFADEKHGRLIQRVCAEHLRSIPTERHSMLASEEERLADIIFLQQKAEAFESLAQEREKLSKTLAREVEDLRQLHELSTEISRLDLKQVISGVLKAVTSLHKTDMGLLSLTDGQNHELAAAASLGFSGEFLKTNARVHAGEGACGMALLVKERVIVEDTETDRAFAAFRETSRKAGFRAVHSTPLIGRRGEVAGVLSVHFRKPRRPSQREIRLMDVYARLAMNAIENARLYEEAQQENARRKQAQAALIQSEKLASVGRLAATIAHEINNPLEAVSNLIFLAQRDLADPGKAGKRLEMAVEELDRVAHLTRQTLGFYRDNSLPTWFEISDTLDELVSIYSRKLEARGITVIKDFDRRARVHALPGEIRQVFSNLIANSIDAMPGGGTLRVKVSQSQEWNNSGLPGVRVTVADTGTGIPEEKKKHLFQAFYTTKKDVGTGLGLWIARGIVEKHHGMIHVRSTAKEGSSGTAFSVFLPVETRLAAEPVPATTN